MAGREAGQVPESELPEFPPQNIFPGDTPDAEIARANTVEWKTEAATSSVDLSAETKAQLAPEAQKTYGQLPERQKRVFERLREANPFRKKEDPVEGVRKAQDYLRGQMEVVKGAKGELGKLEADQKAAKDLVDSAGKRAVEVSKAPEALQELLDDPSLEGVAKEKLQAALKDAKARSDKEFKQLKDEQSKAAQHAQKLEDQLEVTKNRIERFEADREGAKDRLDDAVVRAINNNSENAVQLEGGREQADAEMKNIGEAMGKLDTAIAALEAKAKDAKEPIVVDTLKGLLKDAQTEKAALARTQRELERQRTKLQDRLDKAGKKNEQLVAHLSTKRLETLLDDPEQSWIVPMLSADQVSRLLAERQREVLSGNETNQKALLPKLKEDQLQKLIDAGIVPDKDTLIAQGVFKKPEAPKAKEPVAESAIPKHASGKEWARTFADKLAGGGEFSGDVQLSEMLDDSDLSGGEVADWVYDQARARVENQVGDQLSEKQQEGLIAKVLKFFKEILGLNDLQAAEMKRAMQPKEGRQRFGEAVAKWNKAHESTPSLQVDVARVDKDLQAKEFSPVGVKAYLLEQVRDQGGDVAKAKGLVDEFLKPPEAETPPTAAQAA